MASPASIRPAIMTCCSEAAACRWGLADADLTMAPMWRRYVPWLPYVVKHLQKGRESRWRMAARWRRDITGVVRGWSQLASVSLHVRSCTCIETLSLCS